MYIVHCCFYKVAHLSFASLLCCCIVNPNGIELNYSKYNSPFSHSIRIRFQWNARISLASAGFIILHSANIAHSVWIHFRNIPKASQLASQHTQQLMMSLEENKTNWIRFSIVVDTKCVFFICLGHKHTVPGRETIETVLNIRWIFTLKFTISDNRFDETLL